MLSKTTSTNYLKYGIVTSSFLTRNDLRKTTYTVSDDTVYSVVSYNHSVYIEPREGMAMLRIMQDPTIDNAESFALHRSIKINAGNYFALVPMYGHIIYNLYTPLDAIQSSHILSTPIRYNHIVPTTFVHEIIACYYVVKRPGYVFPGEVHDFYELTYVDQGALETTVDGQKFEIHPNEIMLYGPGQFHDQKIASDESCSYLTVIFRADGLDSSLLNRVIPLSRTLLTDIGSFVRATDLKNAYKNDAMIAALQFFLVSLQVGCTASEKDSIMPTSPNNQHYEDQLLEEIIEYINKHICDPLPIEQICSRFSISRSTLQNLFRNNMKVPPKQYINDAKMAHSRVLIRSGEHTISEVASMLGYNSIHYFSRKFTAHYGVTPSEYARKIYYQKDNESQQ